MQYVRHGAYFRHKLETENNTWLTPGDFLKQTQYNNLKPTGQCRMNQERINVPYETRLALKKCGARRWPNNFRAIMCTES